MMGFALLTAMIAGSITEETQITIDRDCATLACQRSIQVETRDELDAAGLSIVDGGRNDLADFTADITIDQRRNPAGQPSLVAQGTSRSSINISDHVTHVAVVPGLKPGARVEYHYAITYENELFLPSIAIQDALFVDEKRVLIDLPSNVDVDIEFEGAPIPYIENREACGERLQVRLEFRDVDVASPRQRPTRLGLHFHWTDRPEGWDAINQFVVAAYADVDSAIYPELMTLDVSSQDPLNAAFEYVRDQIRYESITLGDHDYIPAEPMHVINRRYGDCKDKAFCLRSLLRLHDIPARLVLVGPRRFQHGVPTISRFNHMILVARYEGSDIFIDPTAWGVSLGSLPEPIVDSLAYIVNQDGPGELVRLPQSELDRIRLEADGEIGVAAIDWRIRISFSGHARAFALAPQDSTQQYALMAAWLRGGLLTVPERVDVAIEDDGNAITFEIRAQEAFDPACVAFHLTPFAPNPFLGSPDFVSATTELSWRIELHGGQFALPELSVQSDSQSLDLHMRTARLAADRWTQRGSVDWTLPVGVVPDTQSDQLDLVRELLFHPYPVRGEP